MLPLTFLRAHARLLAFGFLMSFCSSFGQTFFVSLFSGEIRAAFALSHGGFGTVYSVGTLASAAALIFGGRLIDRWPLPRFAVAVLLGLSAACLFTAGTAGPVSLAVAIFGLRFFGQGLSTHTSLTAMGRYFERERGRAVALASLGFPLGETILPPLIVAVLALADWRAPWLGAAAFLLVFGLPAAMWLLRERGARGSLRPSGAESPHTDHTLGQALRDPGLYLRLPVLLAPAFISTGLIFHQVHIAASKGWPLALMAGSFSLFAIASVVMVLIGGALVDRVRAYRLVPVFLAPLALACLVLAASDNPVAAPVFFVFLGLNAGLATAVLGGLWPELYGVTHLGAIRAFAQAATVFSTGLAPAALGVLIDGGLAVETIALGCAAYCVAASAVAWLARLPRRLR